MKSVARVFFFIALIATFFPEVTGGVALVCGALIASIFGNPFSAHTKKLSPLLLGWSVVGLGAGANFYTLLRVGASGIGYTVVGISLTLLLGRILSEPLKVNRTISWLISAGTAICGGSAIAAVSAAIKPKDEEISVALAVVFLLNAFALFLFPFLGTELGLTANQFAYWCALAIHDTSSVVGAAMTRGDEVLRIATTIKLARALWIFPVALFIARQTNSNSSSKFKVPWFLWGYLGVAAAVTFVPTLSAIGAPLVFVSRRTFTTTLYLVGLSLSPKAIRTVGPKPLILGGLLWILVSAGTLGAIKMGWIR